MNAKLTEIVGRLLQSDLATKLAQNEALIHGLTRAMTLSVELRAAVDERLAAALSRLDLVTNAQVDELHAEIERLHVELSELRATIRETQGPPA